MRKGLGLSAGGSLLTVVELLGRGLGGGGASERGCGQSIRGTYLAALVSVEVVRVEDGGTNVLASDSVWEVLSTSKGRDKDDTYDRWQ